MIQRCHNPNDKDYKNYGARNITVCRRWRESFTDFLSDMGEPPSNKHTIARKNNAEGYSPENCRWATVKEQNNNTRKTTMLTIRGETKPLTEWSALVGVLKATIMFRIKKRGMSPEDAVFKPLVWTKKPKTN